MNILENYKAIFFTMMMLLMSTISQGQVMSMKTKTSRNQIDRTEILDAVRAMVFRDYQQKVDFLVNKMNYSKGYVWFEGEVVRQDKRPLNVDDYDDCCHIEALLRKKGNRWIIVDWAAFATDVWYQGLWNRTGAPKSIFFE